MLQSASSALPTHNAATISVSIARGISPSSSLDRSTIIPDAYAPGV